MMIGVKTDNSVVPDTAASYWVQPIVAPEGTQIVISGRFADARYISLAVYKPNGTAFTSNGVGSSLPDYRIEPGAGGQNPWQHQAGPGGPYTVTIRSDVSRGQADTLPLPPGTTAKHPGYLVYRVYLAAGGDFSGTPLPALSVKEGGVTHALPVCQAHNSVVPAPLRAPGAPVAGTGGGGENTAVPSMLRFYKPAQGQSNGLLGNADTAYVSAWMIRPPAADVVVVTGKAPTSAPGSHPSPWPAQGEDVRYWSMCVGVGASHVPTVVNRLGGGSIDYGCRADDATKLSAAGEYTYVIGSESQRAAIDRIPGATFLPFSTTQPAKVYLLLMRSMLVSESFTHSVQGITRADDPAAAAAVMGPYYPRASVCPLATLTVKGIQACTHQS